MFICKLYLVANTYLKTAKLIVFDCLLLFCELRLSTNCFSTRSSSWRSFATTTSGWLPLYHSWLFSSTIRASCRRCASKWRPCVLTTPCCKEKLNGCLPCKRSMHGCWCVQPTPCQMWFCHEVTAIHCDGRIALRLAHCSNKHELCLGHA